MPNARVLIIADDLTGAMDAAGPFAARGIATWVAACPDDCEARELSGAQVVSVNTESRHLDAVAAAARVAHCFGRVGGADFPIVVKKIDSTLRGNVVAETLALLRVTAKAGTLVAPAFPAQGRTTRDGRVYVRGVPLEDTAFARDALSPAMAIPPERAFAQAGVTVAVRDAESDADLDALVAGLARDRSAPLVVGSAGITSALARAMAVGGKVGPPPAVTGRLVFVVGSRAQASREQVARLEADGALVVPAPNGIPGSTPVLAGNRAIVLVAVPDASGREGDAGDVARALATHGLALARQPGTGALVATGGDTAIAVLRASGNAALAVGGELLPGIACARLLLDGKPLWLVTKAGGFGDPEALREIGRRLQPTSTGTTRWQPG
jgi:uncharacterized protein YgbK (DUF1537 family)